MPRIAIESPARAWLAIVVAVLICALGATASASAEVQVVAVTPGQSADVVISGGTPITIGIGETIEGVTLISADRRGAVLRIDGATQTVPLSPYRGSATSADASSLTLMANPAGHFLASGFVNGTSMRFVVDTGATYTALSRAQAQRIGIDYRSGTPTQSMTVNGVVNGWRVTLDSLQIGGTTEHDVEAVVVDNDVLDIGLLGMSYLNRFDMHRQGKTLVLRRRR